MQNNEIKNILQQSIDELLNNLTNTFHNATKKFIFQIINILNSIDNTNNQNNNTNNNINHTLLLQTNEEEISNNYDITQVINKIVKNNEINLQENKKSNQEEKINELENKINKLLQQINELKEDN